MTATPNGDNRMTVTCPHCNQRFSIPIPHTAVFNDIRSSSAVAAHEKPIRCICGKYSAPVIVSLQISWNVLPLTDEQAAALEPSRIVVPDKTLNLKLN